MAFRLGLFGRDAAAARPADSRFPDIASYAVSDNLGSAMSLLVLASAVTATLGCVS